MSRAIDASHDSSLRSWVDSARVPGCDFPVQNLPFGVFRQSPRSASRIGVAIGDQVLDLAAAAGRGALDGLDGRLVAVCDAEVLNPLLALEPSQWSALRSRLSALLVDPASEATLGPCLVAQDAVEMLLPARVGDYTDFYASVFHATAVGRLFRPDNPLLPNYKHLPIGYHGRASSLVVSGTTVRRPCGQRKSPELDAPTFGPSRMLDYELEVGFLVGGSENPLGKAVPIANAEDRIFGVCLVNDWSARDLQAWEYQPLGPFLAKSFATSVSPWVVTLEALAPFRAPEFERPVGDPQPLAYLRHRPDDLPGVDATLEVEIASEAMRRLGTPPHRLSRASFSQMYWTIAQMLAHHASNGCNLRPGDLMASGTVSGSEEGSSGCLLEITRRGVEPIRLPSGESRALLEDGDEVVLRGRCERAGFAAIGWGECRGRVVPAVTP